MLQIVNPDTRVSRQRLGMAPACGEGCVFLAGAGNDVEEFGFPVVWIEVHVIVYVHFRIPKTSLQNQIDHGSYAAASTRLVAMTT